MSNLEIFGGIVAILLVSLGAFGVLKPALAIGSVVIVPLLIGGVMVGTALIIYNLIKSRQVKPAVQQAPIKDMTQDPFFQKPAPQQQQPSVNIPLVQPSPTGPIVTTGPSMTTGPSITTGPVITQMPVAVPSVPTAEQQPSMFDQHPSIFDQAPVSEAPVFRPTVQQTTTTTTNVPTTASPIGQGQDVIVTPVSQEDFLNWMAQNNPDMLQQIPSNIQIPPMVQPVQQKPSKRPSKNPTVTTTTAPTVTPQPAVITQPTSTPQPTVITQPVITQPTTQPAPAAPSTAPVPATGDTGSSYTPAEVTGLIDAHNKRRAKYGTPPVTWDPTVAKYAQNWATTIAQMGKMQHSSNSPYGENIYWSSSSRGAPRASGETILTGWADEEAPFYDYNSNSCKGGTCLHFTQVVWKDTKRIGCGTATNGNDEYVVCSYDPRGNFNMSQGNRPY
jgi:pathogenesis-related protein 1